MVTRLSKYNTPELVEDEFACEFIYDDDGKIYDVKFNDPAIETYLKLKYE